MRFRLHFAIFACVVSALHAARIAARDCNANGLDDAEEIASGKEADCNSNGLLDVCEIAPLEYDAPFAGIPAGGQPFALASGDVNGDGFPDVAVANYGTDDVTILLGKGTGHLKPAGKVAMGNFPIAVALADVDADGRLDLVTAQSASNDAAVALGNGDGTFHEASHFPVARAPRGLAMADLDLDGLPELVSGSSAGAEALVFGNLGGGTFAPPSVYPVGQSPRSFAAGDFDGDGALDLAVAGWSAADIRILRNAAGNLALDSTLATGKNPVSLAARDLDGDGDLDLAVGEAGAKTVSVFQNLGKGRFALSQILPMDTSPGGLQAADLDGDLDLDLCATDKTTANGGVYVFANYGQGKFLQPLKVFSLRSPSAPLLVDLDGDGESEILVAKANDGAVEVLARGPNGTGLSMIDVTRVVERPHSMASADFDRDGDLDFVTGNGGGGTVTLHRNRGDGTIVSELGAGSGNYLVHMAAGDLDGDGDVDLVAGYTNPDILLNRGTGSFSRSSSLQQVNTPSSYVLADVDGDGDLDVVVANDPFRSLSVFVNNPTGRFTTRNRFKTSAQPSRLAAGDFDGDGDVDLAAAEGISRKVSVHSNPGDGSFTEFTDYSTPDEVAWVEAADVDGDQDLDLISTSIVFLNSGHGLFERGPAFPGDRSPIFLTTGDLDGDHDIDVVAARETPGALFAFLNGGHGDFILGASLPCGAGLRSVFMGDLDGDGDMDVVSANRESSTVTMLFNQARPPITHLTRICTELDFYDVSIPAERAGEAQRTGKFLVPARTDPGLLPPLFQNAQRFPLHQDFLTQVFPDRFPGLGGDAYEDLVARRATRQYFAGVLTRLRTRGGIVYGFTVFTDDSRPAEMLTVDETRAVYERLAGEMRLRPLAYAPESRAAADIARGWVDPGFPVYLANEPGVGYEAYTRGVNYGRVRVLDAGELAEANSGGSFGWQDILVLAEAPSDIEGVVGGVITGTPQGALSHLAVRTARRNTPNAYLAGSTEAFQPLAGKLVRLEVRGDGYSVRPAEPAEAEVWWVAIRPRLGEEPLLDAVYSELDALLDIDVDAGARPESRFGGKASHLARLQHVLTGPFEQYREPGFAIPLRYYFEFLEANRMPSALDPEREVSYKQYLAEVVTSPAIQSDSAQRFTALERFRHHAETNGVVSRDLVERVSARIEQVFGSAETLVRFRSSSNVEDALEFNGAGLYESDSACAADETDGDEAGPSRCDRHKSKERRVETALKLVWASLWTFRGHEERAYYQVPQSKVAMGILVTRAHNGERANGVAFTGNPSNPVDRRQIVTVQLGEESVVSPEPGVTPELDALEIEDGKVARVDRIRRSSLVPDGYVLADSELEELGTLLAWIDASFPVELGSHRRDEVFLDIEFKFTGEGPLVVKQVRPFLAGAPEPPGPTFELEVPEGTTVCGAFQAGRDLATEHALKSRARFRAGTLPMPTRAEGFEATVIEELLVGTAAEPASPRGPGRFSVSRITTANGRATYRFGFEQAWGLPGRDAFTVRVSGFEYHALEGKPSSPALVLNEDFILDGLAMDAGPIGPDSSYVTFSSSTYSSLPLWLTQVQLEGGLVLRLEERLLASQTATGPASLTRALLQIGQVRLSVKDYFHLVYSAFRHNQAPRYRIVLPETLVMDGVPEPVRAIELHTGDAALGAVQGVRFLNDAFDEIGTAKVLDFRRSKLQVPVGDPFRRGDIDSNGDVNLTDAIEVLSYLFLEGALPGCLAAADADDNGEMSLTDAVVILRLLFGSALTLPSPFGACGPDPTPDSLGCEEYLGCR